MTPRHRQGVGPGPGQSGGEPFSGANVGCDRWLSGGVCGKWLPSSARVAFAFHGRSRVQPCRAWSCPDRDAGRWHGCPLGDLSTCRAVRASNDAREDRLEGQAMTRMIRFGRVSCPGARRRAVVAVAVLAACGVAGAVPSAALAGSSSAPTWTKQAPAASPSARAAAAMAYDAATGTIVLFGGLGEHGLLRDTWTWDGSTWTRQAPAASPAARTVASMAYGAATGTIVLFGGSGSHGDLRDTWTWEG